MQSCNFEYLNVEYINVNLMLHIRYGINAVNHKSNLQSILYIPCEYEINIVWHVNYFMETSIKYLTIVK